VEDGLTTFAVVDRLNDADWMDTETEIVQVEPTLVSPQQFLEILLSNGFTLNDRGRLAKLSDEDKSQIRQKWLEHGLIEYDTDGHPIHPIQKYPICGAIDNLGYPCLSYSGNGTQRKGNPGVKCSKHGGASTGCTTFEGRLKQVMSVVTTGESSRYLQALKDDNAYKTIVEKVVEDFKEDPYKATDNVLLGTLAQAIIDYDNAVKHGKSLDASRKAEVILKICREMGTTPKERGILPEPVADIAEIEETVSRRITILEEKKTRTFKKVE